METMTVKRCSRCKREKPRTAFGPNQRAKDGLDYRCRDCHRAYNREYRKKIAARKPDEIPIPPEKRCPKCGVTRPVSDWHQNLAQLDGLAAHCKPCKSAYYAENDEKYRENNRRWRKTNPEKHRAREHRRRARKAGAFTIPHTEEDLLDFWRFVGVDPERCWYCALDGRDSPAEEIDHLKPLAAGGSETVWNKRPACSACNTSKNDRVFPAGAGDERAFRIAREQANLTHLWMAAHNLID